MNITHKRILFCGGKKVGYECLAFMVREKYDIIGVIPNPSDIGKDRFYPSIAELAWNSKIPILNPKSFGSPEGNQEVKNLSPDLIVVVYFDRILKPEIIQIPTLGCINLHLALAEEYRGCYPTTWTILNGETRTGVTLHYIDSGIDSGDIIAQKEVAIEEDSTGHSLYYDCTSAGIELFKEYIGQILNGTAPRRKQNTTEKTRYYKRQFPSQEIDFSQPGEMILRHIRAHLFSPFPPPYFYIGKQKYIIIKEDS